MSVLNETKGVNVKVFNMITRVNETKTLVKPLLCDCKCKFNKTTCNSNQKWSNEKCQWELKSIVYAKKIIVGISSRYICEISRYLKSAVDDSVFVCNEIICVMDSALTKVRNIVPTNNRCSYLQ